MSRHTRTSTQARTIHLNAAVYTACVDDALTNLDLGLAGWPETTPGASPPGARPITECRNRDCSNTAPCPTHDHDQHAETFGPVETEWGHQPAEQLTATERLANQHDKAAVDLDAMNEHSRLADHHLAAAAAIAKRWAYTGIDDTTVKARLVAIDSEIWCSNCVRYGRHEPRAKDRTECTFCGEFRAQRKQACPREIWDARDARGGKIDETTIIRILKKLAEDRKKANAEARARQRLEKDKAS